MIKINYVDKTTNSEKTNITVERNHFPDGTLLLKTPNIDYNYPVEITWFYESDEELFAIICLAKKANRKVLRLPYIPNARQDRVKSNEDVFTLKYFAEIINSLEFEKVYVLDPHSNVSEALFDRVVIEKPNRYVEVVLSMLHSTEHVDDANLVMFFPDEGSSKRYSDMFHLPYAFGIKKRDWKTGQIQGLDVVDNGVNLKGKSILIVDDICSRGGTFYHSAKKLKELGVDKIYLYITHCENTILEGEVLTSGLIEKVYTTNSIFNKNHEKIEVMNY